MAQAGTWAAPLLYARRSAVTRGRFGFALQLKFYQHTGRFPERRSDIPEEVDDGLAEQLATSGSDLQDRLAHLEHCY